MTLYAENVLIRASAIIMLPELLNTVGREKAILRQEAEFLNSHKSNSYLGILTNTSINAVSVLYPETITGMFLLYNYVEGSAIDPASQNGFFDRYLRTQYYAGSLISDEDADRIRGDIKEGKYSQQLEAYLRQRREVIPVPTGPSRQSTAYDQYKAIRDDNDAIHNKRAWLSRVSGLQANLRTVFGEVNYNRAILTEMLLAAPFLEAAVSNDKLDEAASARHKGYVEEVLEFSRGFNPEQRFQRFEEVTKKSSVAWTQEVKTPDLTDLDRPYVQNLYDLAGSMLDGKWDMDAVYGLLKKTILRRGKLFEAVSVRHEYGIAVSLTPTEGSTTSFDDIAGYETQKAYYLNLLTKIKQRDPIVGDIKMVIAAGRPGLGKSIGVQAFLNRLPDNAKGILVRVNTDNIGSSIPEYQMLMRLAYLHSDLDLFAVIEDIDRFAGNRLANITTGMFLEIDSAVADSIPKNFHLIATTNRPDVVDPAIFSRPGRASEVLVYNYPGAKSRKRIARLHAEKNGFNLPEKTMQYIADKAAKFSPDEIGYLFWRMRFNDIKDPTEVIIDRYIKETLDRDKVKQQARTSELADGSRASFEEEYEDELDSLLDDIDKKFLNGNNQI